MPEKKITLESIIEGCKRGDSGSFSLLIDRYSQRMYNFFYSQTCDKDVSDELLSDFYLKLLRNIKSYRGGSFEAWMYRIASNIRYDYLRKLIRERENSLKYSEHVGYLDEQKGRAREGSYGGDGSGDYDIAAALSQIDEDSRELVAMRFYSDLSFKEIAQATGKPIGTVLAKTHRALAKLRAILERQE